MLSSCRCCDYQVALYFWLFLILLFTSYGGYTLHKAVKLRHRPPQSVEYILAGESDDLEVFPNLVSEREVALVLVLVLVLFVIIAVVEVVVVLIVAIASTTIAAAGAWLVQVRM